jgi:hypothetical protein
LRCKSVDQASDRRNAGRTLQVLILLILLATMAIAQSQAPQLSYTRPPADHPVLHEVFFNIAGSLENAHAQRKVQVAAPQLLQVDRDFAGVFKIQASELDRMFQVVRSANTEIKAIEDQMRKHANDRARIELFPDRATMQALQVRRQAAIQSNLARLRTALSAAGWTALSNYINTDLRNSVSFGQPAGKKP